MYLKRLESVGFKSFAERINMEFVPGVTAVVGPNGSGKSNITDAIRWVLGEQSAKSLRGSKMEDIIFQGSDSRSPLNFAEVTLVLDNNDGTLPLDYEEVSVTRRVYRSGVSEFYINKQSCRLKDIIDLFMDSGLGREAFSIISQGKVEEVLSSKPEERRTIFEEAAGVLKYKHRKIKAEYKLTETKENLSRVDDIIYEIEQQIDPLFEQSKKAKKFISQRNLLKKQEISLIITEIEQLHGKWESLLTELDSERMNEISWKTTIQQKETNLEKERYSVQTLDETIEVLQTNLLKNTQLLEQFEGKKQVRKERTKHFTENKTKLEQQKTETKTRIEKIIIEKVAELKKLAELKLDRHGTKQSIEKLQEKLKIGKDSISAQIEELKSIYIEELNKQAAKRNEQQSIEDQLMQLTGKADNQRDKLQDLLVQKKVKTNKETELLASLSTKDSKKSKKDNSILEMKNNLIAQRTVFDEAEQKLYTGYQTIAKLNSRKEMLEEMKEDFQGFFHGVKVILKERKKQTFKNIHGAVVELIDVPQQYIIAIETVLGSQGQHIVVTDDQAARDAISWLKQTNNGRATFLPLKSIKERSLTRDMVTKISVHSGFVGVAADLVKTEEIHEKVVNHLMGHVVIAKTLKDANEIANLTMRRNRVVTLEGDVVNPGGSMSGGAKKKTNQSLFTREKDLENVKKELTDCQSKVNKYEVEVENQKKYIGTIEKELDSKEKAFIIDQQELQEARSAYKRVEMELGSLNDMLKLYNQDKQQFTKDRDRFHERDQQLSVELREIADRLLTVQAEINGLTEQETDLKENYEKNQLKLHQLEVKLAEEEERLRSQLEKTTAIQMQESELVEQYEAFKFDLNELLKLQKVQETELEMFRKIETKKNEIKNTTNDIQHKRVMRSRSTKLIQDQERELKEENKKYHILNKTIQQKEIEANRLDVDLENRLVHLQTEYTITFEKARQTYEKVLNVEEAKTHVKQIKQSMKQLGTVNLGAVEEYDRISERYTFLTDQKSDLVEAIETLYSIIAEMDKVMKERFKVTFSKVKAEFTTVFKELFDGGRAELKLTDEQNILDTGIEIIAQPPGKRLQHLGLLSGGERALTAIALLFSILRVRPVPFCILDEVEAALDEANVVRFAKYVKLHSKDTQFIVITHRKGTMEEADVLYGITMQESGVSRLVSVRLENTMALVNL